MKNYILTFLLAVLVVLASVVVRNTLANGNAVGSEGTAVMAIGPGPMPIPPSAKAIGPGPMPIPPRAKAIGPGPMPIPPSAN
jgi:hypothetical protein